MLHISRFEAPDTEYATPDEVPEDILAVTRLLQAAAGHEGGGEVPGIHAVNSIVEDLGIRASFAARYPGRSRIVGFALYEPFDVKRGAPPNTSWLSALAVDRNQRSQGIGMTMVNHLVDVARADGVDAIRLRSRANERTIQFYLRNGFVKEDEHLGHQMPIMRRDI